LEISKKEASERSIEMISETSVEISKKISLTRKRTLNYLLSLFISKKIPKNFLSSGLPASSSISTEVGRLERGRR
jgi:hypothetical protein